MYEDLFIFAQSALSSGKCSLRLAQAFVLWSTRMITSVVTDDRHRGGAALQDSGSVPR